MPKFNHGRMNRYRYQTGATSFDTIDRIKLDAAWRLVAEYEADRDLTESLERIASTYKKEK